LTTKDTKYTNGHARPSRRRDQPVDDGADVRAAPLDRLGPLAADALDGLAGRPLLLALQPGLQRHALAHAPADPMELQRQLGTRRRLGRHRVRLHLPEQRHPPIGDLRELAAVTGVHFRDVGHAGI
jgi:hypothetical protein